MAGASTLLSHDLYNCPLCQKLLKDPVTIPCGRSFCMECIVRFWNDDDQRCVYICPQCEEPFTPKPSLNRNNNLNKKVEELKKSKHPAASSAHCYAGPGDVECDSCTGRKCKAVISCLDCQASYCKYHLNPHFQSPDYKKHKIVEACAKLQEKIDSEHGKVMEIYCRTDQSMMDKHKGHNTVATKAERTEKQNELKEEQMKSQQRIQEKQKAAQDLKKTSFPSLCVSPGCEDSPSFTVNQHVSFDGVRKSLSDLKERVCEKEFNKIQPDVLDQHHSKEKHTIHRTEMKTAADQMISSSEAENRREFFLQCFCYLTLDPNTVHRRLILSEKNRVVTRTKARRSEKQNELKEEQMKSQQRIQEKQKKVQELKQTVDIIKMRSQAAVGDSERIFTELISSMEKKRSEVKKLIRTQEKAEVSQTERLLNQLEQEIADLKRRVTELEELSQTPDDIHFLQSFPSLCVSPGCEDSPSFTVNQHLSFDGVRKSLSDLKERVEQICEEEFKKIRPQAAAAQMILPSEPKINKRNLQYLKQQVEEVLQAAAVQKILPSEPKSRDDFLQYFHYLTLDPNTEHPNLILSEKNRVNELKEEQMKSQQLIQEKQKVVQELKQTVDIIKIRSQAAVDDSERIFTELISSVEKKRSEVKELIRAQEKAENELKEEQMKSQQLIQEKQKVVQELKQTVDIIKIRSQAAVDDSERIFTELISSVEKKRSEVKELIRAQEKAENELKEEQMKSQQMIQEKQKKVQVLRVTVGIIKIRSQAAVDDSERIFTELISSMEKKRSEVMELIRAQEKAERVQEGDDAIGPAIQAVILGHLPDDKNTNPEMIAKTERTEKQNELKGEQMKSQQRIQEKQKKVQELKQTVDIIKMRSQAAVDDSEKIFTELISSIEKKSSEATELIRSLEKAELRRAERLLNQLEQEIADLKRRVTELEELSHTHDHIHFLQSFPSLCVSPGCEDSPSFTVNQHLSFNGVRKSLSDLKKRVNEICEEEFNKIHPQAAAAQKILPLETKINKHNLQYLKKRVEEVLLPKIHPQEPKSREDFLQYFRYLTLDPNTTHPELILSEKNRVIRSQAAVDDTKTERTEKQNELKVEQMKFQQRIQEKQNKMQELKQTVDIIKIRSQAAVDDSERIFTELISSMEKKRSEVKELIRTQEKAEVSRTERLLNQLEQEIADLKRRVTELEELSQTHDHIHFLQSFPSLCVSPGCEDSPSFTVNQHLSFDGVRKSLSDLKKRVEQICEEKFDKVRPQAAAAQKNLPPEPKINKHNLQYLKIPKIRPQAAAVQMILPSEPKSREDFLQYFCYLTLDPNTIHPHLIVSEMNRVVTRIAAKAERTEKQNELKEEQMKSQQRIQEKQKVVQELKQTVDIIKMRSQAAVGDSERIFTELISSMEKKRSEVMKLIRTQEKAESFPSLCVSPGCEDSPSFTVNQHLSFDGVRKSLSDLKKRVEQICEEEFNKIRPQVAPVQKILFSEPQSREDFLQYFCYLTLDPNTAHPDLILSEKNRVVTCTKTERTEKQNELKEEQMKSQQRIQEKQKKVQELKQTVDIIKMRSQAAVGDSERIFTELISSMEKKRSEVKELIRAQEKAEVSRAERLLNQLEQEIADLKRRVTELEQFLQIHDDIHFLQSFPSLCVSPGCEDSPSFTVNQHLSFDGVRKSLSDLKERVKQICEEEFNKIRPQAAAVQMILPSELKIRKDFMLYFCYLTLDPNTEHPILILSEKNRVKKLKEEQQKTQWRIKEKQKKVQELEQTMDTIKTRSQAAVDDSERIFTELISSMEKKRSEVMELIRDQEKAEGGTSCGSDPRNSSYESLYSNLWRPGLVLQ
ncbi:hypothetical protein KOW79_014438, partial [Hemibagrus wyckioides]